MKKNLFNIDESEKMRILEMHLSATKKQYLNEQGPLDPAAYAQDVDNIKIVDGNSDLTLNFIDNKNMGGKGKMFVTFTATITKSSDKKDTSGNIIPGKYVMFLDSDSSNFRLRIDNPCNETKVTQVIEDYLTRVANPPIGSEKLTMTDFFKQAKISSANPFIQNFKQNYCKKA